MRKPIPSRALCRLLLLTASVAGSQRALAQSQPTVPPTTGAPIPATDTLSRASSPAIPPELGKLPVPTVFTASVVDENGEPLMGVRLTSNRGSLTALTDSVGQAVLPGTTAGDELTLTIEQSVIRRFTVGADLTPLIALDTHNPAVARLKPVRLLFNTALRPDLTAASAQPIYNRALNKFPVSTFLNALAGQAAGLQGIQSSGQPTLDVANVTVLGQSPTLVIDGIVRNNSSLDPIALFDLEEIESVTVLRDALSTAMLGVRNSDGGILNITTRKGTPGQPRISVTAQTGIQQPLKFPKALDAFNYATLYNEARTNEGLAPAYSAQDLALYQNGQDPTGHPNVNWQDQVLKKTSRLDRYTFSASGGNRFSKYFVSLEHLNQTGLLRSSDATTYSTSNSYKVYTVRSNIDLQLTRKTSAGLRVLGRLQDVNDAGTAYGGTNGAASILQSVLETPANAYPVYNADGSYGATQQFSNNILAQNVSSGYRENYKRNVIADVYLQRTLDELTPGLYVRATASYFASLSENVVRNRAFSSFQQLAPGTAGGAPTYRQFSNIGNQANTNGISYQSNTSYAEAQLGYNRQLGSHGVNAVLVGSTQSTNTGSDLLYTVQGISGRTSYNYAGKYVAEFAFGLNGSNRYPDNGNFRYGFFPAGGLAWNISRERFLADQKWLSYLKLYTSLGLTGNDVPGYFTYIQTYGTFGNHAIFGTAASGVTGSSESTPANLRTWEKARKLSLGVQGAVLDNHLGFTLEYYNSLYYDRLQQRGNSTTIFGNNYPDENLGRSRYYGATGQLTYQQSLGSLSVFGAVNLGVQYSEALELNEVARPFAYQVRTGQPVGMLFGYVADGLYQSAAEIAASPRTNYLAQPGDIKYRDLNGDGRIDYNDQTAIGTAAPSIPFGASLGAAWKGFDFSMLWQGTLNRQIYLSGSTEYAFPNVNNGFGNAFEQHLDRWTPDNPNASYPRLGLGGNTNNFSTSSYWLKNNSFVRLRNLEVGYTLPLGLSKQARLQGIRLFVNGTNLVTFSQYDRIDPEAYNGAYPVQRVLNAGLNIKL